VIKPSVLVVEDDDAIRELISYSLLKVGYQVAGVASGEEALAIVQSRPIDLVVLDFTLSEMDGLSVCRRLKGDPKTARIPIIVVTVEADEGDVIAVLDAGADDYVTKPFGPRVLLARIAAILHRAAPAEAEGAVDKEASPDIKLRDLEIQSSRYRVLYQGRPLALSRTEFRMLRLLATKPGWVFTRQQIIGGIHGAQSPVTERSVDTQIAGLRKRLGPAGEYIETVRGFGYRLREE
jgi:two-component system phosphate regulon response regulator PhoB